MKRLLYIIFVLLSVSCSTSRFVEKERVRTTYNESGESLTDAKKSAIDSLSSVNVCNATETASTQTEESENETWEVFSFTGTDSLGHTYSYKRERGTRTSARKQDQSKQESFADSSNVCGLTMQYVDSLLKSSYVSAKKEDTKSVQKETRTLWDNWLVLIPLVALAICYFIKRKIRL